jgi:hypothetical protein
LREASLEIQSYQISPEDARVVSSAHDHGLIPGQFPRKDWAWGVLEDLRTLARLRHRDGMVEPGMRDLFGHLAGCQLATIVPANILAREISAVCKEFLPPDYVRGQLIGHSSSVIERAKRAAAGERVMYRGIRRKPTYSYSKTRMMDLLEIRPHEEHSLRCLISYATKRQREIAADRAAGVIPREQYEAPAKARRSIIAEMRAEGFGGRAIADRLGISDSEVRRLLRGGTNA